jgi:cytoskeletal protein RodZ
MTSRLKEARELAGYSIDDISEKLNIRRQYLVDLEEEKFEHMPGKIYVDGYIRIYSKFLGIDLQSEKKEKEPSVRRLRKVGRNFGVKYHKYLILASSVILVLIMLFYQLFI